MTKKASCLLAGLVFFTLLAACGKDDDNPALVADMTPYHFSEGTLGITLPTSFTPNGDGRNDLYRPVLQGSTPSGYSLTVSDAGGTRLFTSAVPMEGWYGYDDATSKYYPAGIYKATLSFTPANGTPIVKDFNFTILPYNTAAQCWITGGRSYYFEDQIDPATGAIDRFTQESYCPE